MRYFFILVCIFFVFSAKAQTGVVKIETTYSGTVKPATAAVVKMRCYQDTLSPRPLWIVDGMTQQRSALKDLNPGDIESITVLKGESALKAYGNKGENGVVIVTTKCKSSQGTPF